MKTLHQLLLTYWLRIPGRPRERRRRIRRKSETTATCRNCGIPEHNKAKCPHAPGYKIWKKINDETEINDTDNNIDDAKQDAKTSILDSINNDEVKYLFF